MLGWRGASRYYDDNFREAFGLECEAVKRIRDVFGLKNLDVMIPVVRTLKEAKKVLKVMAKFGLEKEDEIINDRMRIYAMCEVPSNAILANQFLDLLDGYSIGSNDLTQLTLGIDRDSERIAKVYDERDPAVKILIKNVIEVCNRRNKYCGICGEAPSTYPEFTKWLVQQGIQSISLSPDVLVDMWSVIENAELRQVVTKKDIKRKTKHEKWTIHEDNSGEKKEVKNVKKKMVRLVAVAASGDSAKKDKEKVIEDEHENQNIRTLDPPSGKIPRIQEGENDEDEDEAARAARELRSRAGSS